MTDTAHHDEAFREALRVVGDPDRLLPGEEPNTRYVDDARHWRSVYEELLHFKDQLMTTARRASENLRRPARHEASDDLNLLEAERGRLRSRYEFWKRRAEELAG